MNDKVQQFINGVGALTEIWIITYNNFIKQGMSAADAMTHTREFMKAFMSSYLSTTEEGDKK